MKKVYLLAIFFVPFFSMAQNVGIGTTTPVTKLTVRTPTDNFGITHTDGIVRVGTYVGPSGGWIATQSFHPLYFATGLLNGNNSAQMALQPDGNLGIGTINPSARLTVQTMDLNYGLVHTNGNISLGTYIGSGMGWVGTKSNHPLAFFTNNGSPQMTLHTNGNLGIGVTSPANRLQIGIIGTSGFSGNDLAIGNGTNALAVFQSNTSSQFASSTDIILMPKIFGGSGKVGINVTNPGNKLQIGSIGATRFSNYDLAIGNGTNALAIIQTNTATQFASSTDIIFTPRLFGGGGRVGIGTFTPRAPLEVVNGINITNPLGPSYSFLAITAEVNNGFDNPIPNISIFASGRVLAEEVDVYSDERIKDISSISNTTKDLRTLNALKITNYTMKDKLRHGNKPSKKVIAQEVEKVYPQVVSKHTDFIPNVYQLTTKMEKTADGYSLNFAKKHNISTTAKKIRVILPEGGLKEMNVVSVPSETQLVVNGIDIEGDKLFVYGEEVNDFRTVDYEGLTTLNISATQELGKLIKKQQKKMDILQQEILLLRTELRSLKQPQNKLTGAKQHSVSGKSKKVGI